MNNSKNPLWGGYTKQNDIPLGSYAVLVGIYNALLGGLLWQSSRKRTDNNTMTTKDLLLLGVSIHKLSRVITKDAVMAPFRAPFGAKYREDLGYGEVNETSHSKAKGMKKAIGELLTCNYCSDMWIGLGMIAGFKAFPKQARTLMDLFSAVTLADFLHVHYELDRTQGNVLTLKEEQLEKKTS